MERSHVIAFGFGVIAGTAVVLSFGANARDASRFVGICLTADGDPRLLREDGVVLGLNAVQDPNGKLFAEWGPAYPRVGEKVPLEDLVLKSFGM